MTPMFPLGSVLFPHMPLALRVFEPRYLQMLGDLLEQDQPEFGVVLIERGHEVGGGDHRFGVGTVAQIVGVEALAGHVALVAKGTRRFTVRAWASDDPYPRADVEDLPEFTWDPRLTPMREQAEQEVRRALRTAEEFGAVWPVDVELSEDPLAACWQLAAVTPVGALDQIALLQAPSLEALLAATAQAAREAQETIRLGWPGI